MKHISVDLETMGVAPTSAIVAIGAVEFDTGSLKDRTISRLGREFYVNVDLRSCIDAGLTIDASTVMWWLRQSEDARNALTDTETNPTIGIKAALLAFSSFWETTGAEFLWARGQDFDVALLNNAYGKLGLRKPWKYNNARDSRTLYSALDFDASVVMQPNIHAHNALEDAKWEARAICTAVSKAERNASDLLRYRSKYFVPAEPADALLALAEEGAEQ